MRKSIRPVSVFGAAVVATMVGFMGSGAHLAGAPPPKTIALTPIGVYRSNVFDGAGAEISAYDAASRRLFVVNVAQHRIDVLDISNPTAPFLAHTIDVSQWGSNANSVATHDGIVAIAVQANPKTSPGKLVFMNAFGGLLSVVTVGALPDMVTFTPNGQMALVANEGEPNSYIVAGSIDPEGSISIVDLRGGVSNVTQDDVATAGFTAFNNATLDSSIRIFGPGASVAQDLEPEYITVSHDSQTAWVTLQENNALAIVDLRSKSVTSLVGLGFKDASLAPNAFDASDRDGQTISIMPRPVFEMYLPDGIAEFQYQGKTYLVTANEGDVREWPGLPSGSEAARVSALTLDPTAFPNRVALQNNASLGRLNVTRFKGDTDGDNDFDQLYAFGGRSFSIWTADGTQVFDSGSALERLIAQRSPDLFNATHTNNVNTGNPNDWTRDNRSDDKGPEPETVTIARLFGRQYAFIALERVGGIVIYELTDPAAPVFVDYVNTRKLGFAANSAAAEDLGPEGTIVISEDNSPTGRPLLVLANEVSGTTRIFEISQVAKK